MDLWKVLQDPKTVEHLEKIDAWLEKFKIALQQTVETVNNWQNVLKATKNLLRDFSNASSSISSLIGFFQSFNK